MSQAKPYPLRMPDEMRDQLQSLATASGRSLNAEIVYRLQQSIEQEVTDEDPVDGVREVEGGFRIVNDYRFSDENFRRHIEEMNKRLANIEESLKHK